MREKFFFGALVLVVGVAIGSPLAVSAAGPSELAGEMSQSDVALEIYQAVDMNHRSATGPQAMLALQARGLVPQTWNGRENVTMAEVGRIMNLMGIEVGIANPDDAVNAARLGQVLKTWQTEIGRVAADWDNGDQFPESIILSGTGTRRIISSSGF